MKNISIEIGSIAVEGVPAGPSDDAAIGRSIERELGRRLRDGALAGIGARNLAALRLGELRLPSNPTYAQIGEAVAATLAKALGRRG